MANYKVSGTDLASIANAIRTKGGTSSQLSFPLDFVSAIGNIPTSQPVLTTKSISANGTYNASSDNADGYSQVTVAVNQRYVVGTFTGTTNGEAKSITIPYQGNGHPVACIIFPSYGVYKSDSPFYTTIQKKAVGIYAFVKNNATSTPDYTNDTDENYAMTIVAYKSSDTASNAFATSYTANSRLLVQGDAVGNSSIYRVVKINSATSISVYIASTDKYGFMKDIEYTYLLLYSS